MSNFRIGQRVAATEDLECGISKGAVFTVAGIERARFVAFDGSVQQLSLHFAEIKPRAGYGGFDHRFFRPIVGRKTDISQFKAMLNYQAKVVVIS